MNTVSKLFCDLVQIPSPSGKELAVGKFVQTYLAGHGIKATFDTTGKGNGSNAGNLIAKLTGDKNLPTLLLVAHLDTVETGDRPITPKVKNGVITSDGTTVLGADDKAAVACLMEVLVEISRWEKHPSIIAVFTTKEEEGTMGASLLRLPDKIDYCFNLDGPSDLGAFMYQTLGEVPFEIELIGRAAHAAVEPEKGINALAAAALLITKLSIGKDAQHNALNIGTIQSGKANNIVPDHAKLKGMVRSFTQGGLEKLLLHVEQATQEVCAKTGCTYALVKHEKDGAPPASLEKNHPIIKIAQKAAKAVDLPFKLEQGAYTTDGNFLAQHYPTLTFSQGGKNPHAFDEFITVEDLEKSNALLVEIIKQSML